MDHYDIWVDLLPGVRDLDFVAAVQAYLDPMRAQGLIAEYRIARRKFGFAPPELREFHIRISVESLAQLDEAFRYAATREDPVEALHAAVYSKVTGFRSALYRDFPDSVRKLDS
ncbi:MAG: DUF6614 family protein [Fimbriimonadaceae bacterium]|nr:DUF6614 family protein [Fimbriimonadaceae bacterium]